MRLQWGRSTLSTCTHMYTYIINHPQFHHKWWYKPFPNGWFMALFYHHYTYYCIIHMARTQIDSWKLCWKHPLPFHPGKLCSASLGDRLDHHLQQNIYAICFKKKYFWWEKETKTNITILSDSNIYIYICKNIYIYIYIYTTYIYICIYNTYIYI